MYSCIPLVGHAKLAYNMCNVILLCLTLFDSARSLSSCLRTSVFFFSSKDNDCGRPSLTVPDLSLHVLEQASFLKDNQSMQVRCADGRRKDITFNGHARSENKKLIQANRQLMITVSC